MLKAKTFLLISVPVLSTQMHQSVLSLCCANGCTSYVVEVSVVLQAQFIILLMDFCVAISRVTILMLGVKAQKSGLIIVGFWQIPYSKKSNFIKWNCWFLPPNIPEPVICNKSDELYEILNWKYTKWRNLIFFRSQNVLKTKMAN